MITNLQIPWKKITRDLKFPMVFIVIYMSGMSIADYYLPLEELHIPIGLITVPGTVIALLLGFRTNSAYDRWWEARIIWGAIVNDSRSWVRQLMTFIDYRDHSTKEFSKIKQMSMRHVVWNYTLARHLRKQEVIEGLTGYVSDKEKEALSSKSNVPNALLFIQGEELKTLFKDGTIDRYQFVQLDSTLTKLTDSMGKCERIKNTVFPSSYTLLVEILIYLWIVFLPFGLVDMIGFVLIPTTISLAFSFLVVERVAVYLQDPFENLPSDTAMITLSRVIEINIKEELDEKEIPKPLQPVDGVLM